MKKIIFGILSILFIIGSFSEASLFVKSPVINHSGLDYLCYSNSLSVYTGKTFPQYVGSYDYYSIPFSCGSFDTLNSFSPYFKFFTEYSGFVANYFSSSSSSFRFFSKSLSYFPAVAGVNIYSSFIQSSLTTSSTRNFISSNYLLKINLDNGEFLSYNPTNIQGFFYDNYFFSGVSLGHNNLLNSFYLPGVASSFVYDSSSGFIFQTVFNDGYNLNDVGKIISFNTNISGLLVVPLLDFGYNYLTGSKTLLLKFYNNSLVYNILDCFSSTSSVLKSCSVIDKGYFNNYSDFLLNSGFVTYGVDLSVLYPLSSKNYYSFVYYNSGVLSSFYFPTGFGDIGSTGSNSYYHDDYKNLIVSKKSFELTSDFSVSNILSSVNFPLIPEESLKPNLSQSLDVICKLDRLNPLCIGGPYYQNTGTDISFTNDGSGNITATVTLYDAEDENCPDIYFTGSDGQLRHQYFDRVCYNAVVFQESDSTPQEDLTSELTGLENNIKFAFSGIVGPNFKFYSCPFNSPLKALHLSSIGGLSIFLLDKFFDVNLVGPFNCLLGGILYSETDSVSLGSRLLSDSYHGEKFLNNFPGDVKNTINWLLFAGMVLFFWAFRPKDH